MIPQAGKRVAVIGLGAIGGVVAGSLAALRRDDIVLCTRSRIERLKVEWPEETLDVEVNSVTDPAALQPVEWVLLCTKAHQTASLSPWLERLCGPETRVAVLQNGISQAESLTPLVGAATIVPTIVFYNGERLAPDHMRARRAYRCELATRDDREGLAFADLLAGTSMRVQATIDFHTLAWRKLLINAAANPITALTLRRQEVLRRDDIKTLCMVVLEEAAAVGRADGAELGPDEATSILSTLMTFPPDAGTSMYFDRLAGRPFEVEALTGAIVARGKALGVPSPMNEALLALLRATNEGR